MTETLAEKTCTPCRGDIPPLTRDEAQHFQAQAPNWELGDNAHRIERAFRFRDFREIAAAEKINETYVGRVLRLTLLAPDIVEAIVNGRQPAGLQLDEL